MLRSEAARYARWSAAVALLLVGVTTAVYLERHWKTYLDKKTAPAPAPVDVSRQSNGINFKKENGTQTIFEVQASKSTEFKGQDASLLEDVRITIFGKTGERHDVIHTQSCRYGKEDLSITCSGDVQIDLMSAVDAKQAARNPAAAKALVTHVETHDVRFDRASGIAQTDQQVTFAFPNGSGDAVGMQYESEEGTIRLRRNVRLTLLQPPGNAGKKTAGQMESRLGQEVHVKGASLDFGRDTRVMHLHGPAEAETPTERLTAGQISLALDDEFRAEKIVATTGAGGNRPALTSKSTSDEMKLEADTLTARFSPEGWLSKLDATGAVHALRSSAAEADEAIADSGTLELWPRVSQPKELNLNGSVVLKTQQNKTGDARLLQTSAFRMEFSGGKEREAGKPQKAETLAAGTMEWTDAAPQGGGTPARTKLQADKLVMDFGQQGQARQLQATGNVRTERSVTGHPVQTATAKSGVAQMSATGGWSQMDLQGDVKLKEGDRSGQAEHATFQRASQTATLAGQAVARDATTETHASRITFVQTTGDIQAEGGVRSTDLSPRGSAVQLASAPANITADTLQANSKAGRALYSGHARLWQGDSVLQANSIELLRDARVLNAVGNVQAVFPQAPGQPGDRTAEPSTDRAAAQVARHINTSQATAKKPHLWHTTCGTLAYWDKEGRAHLEQNVVVQSAEQRMLAPALDLYFTRGGQAAPNASNGANPGSGAQQISRAVGTGGVTVEEGGRKATAERGEYTAANGKFVMSGGNPTLYDGSAGTTTGRQLTFFLADDTIIVDSENGSRTLTKHRVEK
jgi:lipopolysaccharide export system protein LptA/lipopolysaccharide export system protein LptC